jgi:hypothetical protein
MMEVVYYHKLDAGFVSFPAENYVDYMTNVMPVPERHIFYLPKRHLAVFCEVERKFDESVFLWGMFLFEIFPDVSVEVFVDSGKLDLVVDSLVGVSSSCVCGVCDDVLGGFFRGCA